MQASGKENNFTEEYEAFINSLSNVLINDSVLQKTLEAKREFGIRKYGNISFQASKENASKVNTLQHAREELVDYMNYTLHELYKHTKIKPNTQEYERAICRLELAKTLYKLTR